MSSRFLNLNPNQTAATKLFFGPKLGVFDNIEQTFPDVDRYVKVMRSLNWDEHEQPMAALQTQLDRVEPYKKNMLVNTIAWQWETDTVAARMLVPVLSNVVSYDGLARLYTEIQANEYVHSAMYSEITKKGFTNPAEVRNEIMSRKAAFDRLRPSLEIFDEAYEALSDYGRGLRPYSRELGALLLKFLFTITNLECTQFAGSFSVAAFLGLNSELRLATDNIQKIAQDELRVHVPAGMAVIDHYLNSDEGLLAFTDCRDWMVDMSRTIVKSEMEWNREILFSEVSSIQGDRISHSVTKADRYILWRNQILMDFLRIDTKLERVEEHPIPWIEGWINISSVQGSPQEKRPQDYLVTPVTKVLEPGPVEFHW